MLSALATGSIFFVLTSEQCWLTARRFVTQLQTRKHDANFLAEALCFYLSNLNFISKIRLPLLAGYRPWRRAVMGQ